jgi:hypothetical protein
MGNIGTPQNQYDRLALLQGDLARRKGESLGSYFNAMVCRL